MDGLAGAVVGTLVTRGASSAASPSASNSAWGVLGAVMASATADASVAAATQDALRDTLTQLVEHGDGGVHALLAALTVMQKRALVAARTALSRRVEGHAVAALRILTEPTTARRQALARLAIACDLQASPQPQAGEQAGAQVGPNSGGRARTEGLVRLLAALSVSRELDERASTAGCLLVRICNNVGVPPNVD